jgi:N-acetylglucosamine malate deacetylase 1
MKTLVVAPHPDDEVLGAGGTLLRRKAQGGSIAWLIVTDMTRESGWPEENIVQRTAEIQRVSLLFGFARVFNLALPTTKLDTLPVGDVVQKIAECIQSYRPEEILIPHPGDVHTDHGVVFNAVVSCTKWFRNPFIKRILSYETISETDFGLDSARSFVPNVFVDISDFIDQKLEAMEIYASEMGEFPFPRSRRAIEALARYRGSTAGFAAAEAFQLLRERQ